MTDGKDLERKTQSGRGILMGDSELEVKEVLLKHVSFEQRPKAQWGLVRVGGALSTGEEQCHGLWVFRGLLSC